MNPTVRTTLVVAFVVVVILFLLFGGGMMTGATMSGGMMGGGMTLAPARSAGVGGISWMWIPTVLTLGLGILLGWVIFGKK